MQVSCSDDHDTNLRVDPGGSCSHVNTYCRLTIEGMNCSEIDFNIVLVRECFKMAKLILFPVQIDEMSQNEI